MSDVNVFYIFIVFCIIILSMTLHEAMHAFVSYWQGDDTAKQDGRLNSKPYKAYRSYYDNYTSYCFVYI